MKTLAAILSLAAVLQNGTIRVDVNLQQVIVTVRDEAGRIVKGLKAEDFVLEEDGTRQTIAHFDDSPDSPVSVAILIDSTQSMSTMPGGSISGVSGAKGIAHVLLSMLKPADEVLVITFGDSTAVRQPFTTDRKKLEGAIEAITLSRSARSIGVLNALPVALAEVRKANNRRRALVLMTDAYFGGSLDEAARTVRGAEVPIFTFVMRGAVPGAQYLSFDDCATTCHLFGILPPQSRSLNSGALIPASIDRTNPFLEMLSRESGGRSVLFEMHLRNAMSRMRDDLEDIAAELRGQYVLGYYPAGDKSRSNVIRARVADSTARAYVRREIPEASRLARD